MANTNKNSDDRDLVLAPNTHAFILNQQKGQVEVYVGPHKSNLDVTDCPVRWNYETKKFEECMLAQSISNNLVAPEGWYLTLKNPAKGNEHPTFGTNNNKDLDIGRKINIQGPDNFALWPGQMCNVIQGHHLRSNQYLIVRVYDEDSAKTNWNKSVIRTIEKDETAETVKPETTDKKKAKAEAEEAINVTSVKEDDISMGKMFVIKGTEVSFYIPPTGVEVLRVDGDYVQNAVTLERLEYCVLLDEGGDKEYVRGPAVVFPKPTQSFITEKSSARKYRAITLNDNSGLYISVVKDYTDSQGKKHKAGDELFITGKDCSIYYPREEHAIIKYGNKQKHHSIAIPVGEGRYVMDRHSGAIELVKGPQMLLPDPRNSVIVKRVLSDGQTVTWFPGNKKARDYNTQLRGLQLKNNADYITTDLLNTSLDELAAHDEQLYAASYTYSDQSSSKKASKKFAGDVVTRGSEFSKPRTICLDNSKYDGAVRVGIWRGYAVCIESKSGKNKVVVGPCSELLEYDEELHVSELSKGRPKSTQQKVETPYLRILNNRIRDRINVVTKDLCNVQINLSYMVNFAEEHRDKWFNVQNYVQFLCERMRSIIQRMVKEHGIEAFHQKYIDLIRDLVLNKGSKKDSKIDGRFFEENGMYISDVEISSLEFEDEEIEEMLNDSQNEIVRQSLSIAREKRTLALIESKNEIKQKIDAKNAETALKQLDIEAKEKEKALEVDLIEVERDHKIDTSRKEFEQKRQTLVATIEKAKIDLKKAHHEEDQAHQKALVDLEGQRLVKESEAFVKRFEAISPQLITALEQLGDKNLTMAVSKNLSIHSLLGDKNLMEVLKGALGSTALGNNLDGILNGYKNLKEITDKKPKKQ